MAPFPILRINYSLLQICHLRNVINFFGNAPLAISPDKMRKLVIVQDHFCYFAPQHVVGIQGFVSKGSGNLMSAHYICFGEKIAKLPPEYYFYLDHCLVKVYKSRQG